MCYSVVVMYIVNPISNSRWSLPLREEQEAVVGDDGCMLLARRLKGYGV